MVCDWIEEVPKARFAHKWNQTPALYERKRTRPLKNRFAKIVWKFTIFVSVPCIVTSILRKFAQTKQRYKNNNQQLNAFAVWFFECFFRIFSQMRYDLLFINWFYCIFRYANCLQIINSKKKSFFCIKSTFDKIPFFCSFVFHQIKYT